MTKQTFTFNQTEVKNIAEFADKYPDSLSVEVSTESGNGIGHFIEVSIATFLNDDWVTVTKTISDEKSW
jgi:hypothetical protein